MGNHGSCNEFEKFSKIFVLNANVPDLVEKHVLAVSTGDSKILQCPIRTYPMLEGKLLPKLISD